MSMWIEGTVVENQQWTDSLYSIKIEAPIAPFTAGQFCRIGLDIEGKKVSRPYSFVNPPSQSVHEFYYIHLEEGALTPRLVALKAGDPIFVAKKGAGLFTLKQVEPKETLWCMSTGTALGVFLSILRTTQPWETFKHIVLVHGVRTNDELNYQETIEQLKAEHDNFTFVSCVSREPNPSGLDKRITTAIHDGSLEALTNLELNEAKASVMLCGNPAMVGEVTQILKDRGLSESHPTKPGQITCENYWKD